MQIKTLIACLVELKLKRTPSISIHKQNLVWSTFLFSAVQHQKKRPDTSLNDLFLRTNFSLKDAELSTCLARHAFIEMLDFVCVIKNFSVPRGG